MLMVTAVGNSREGAENQLLPSICGRERKLPCKACPTLLHRVFHAPKELRVAVACSRQPEGLMESCCLHHLEPGAGGAACDTGAISLLCRRCCLSC